jgi:imidazolonepropionase-like amidohydrolase
MGYENVNIHAGWLVDGSGAAAQPGIRISLKEGTIRSIRKMSGTMPDAARSDMPGLDLSDCTILPGLIDCHVHLAMSPDVGREPSAGRIAEGHHGVRRRISKHLDQLLVRGILAVRDGGDPDGSLLQYKTSPDSENAPLYLCAAGKAWHRPGRYGRLIGSALPVGRTLAETILHENKDISHVKIVNSGLNSLTEYASESAPQFDSAELKDAVRAARQRGFKTMVHANGKLPVKIAVEAGCDSIEHGFFMGRENMYRMAEKGTTWVPTACTMKALGDRMKRNGAASDVARKNLEHQIRQIQAARETGVRIALGTDAGSPGVVHGQALVEEMRIFMDAGYPIEEVVCCASRNSALLLGLPQHGLVTKNMAATFIAVKGPPSQLPESLNQIELILYNGKQLKIDSYRIK